VDECGLAEFYRQVASARRTKLAARGRARVNGLWAGTWRSGSDGYDFWGNVSEANFLSKWSALAGQNLRLIDMIALPLNKSGIPSGALAHGTVGVNG
jgi:hypothetical protein